MEGYDVVVIGSFYGHPAFLKRFGVPDASSTNGYVIPAEWQSALSNGSSAGGILGLLLNGMAADRYGPKIVMMTSLIALIGFIFIMVFANSLEMLVIGEVFVSTSLLFRVLRYRADPIQVWNPLGSLPDAHDRVR
jgi:SP family general alpha glucoside:H+ symporter-like MFS transporter